MKEKLPLELTLEISKDFTIKVKLHNISKKPIIYFPKSVDISLKNERGKKVDYVADVLSVASQTAPPPGPPHSDLATIESGKTILLGETVIRKIADRHEFLWENRFIFRIPSGKYSIDAIWNSTTDKYWEPKTDKFIKIEGAWLGKLSSTGKFELP